MTFCDVTYPMFKYFKVYVIWWRYYTIQLRGKNVGPLTRIYQDYTLVSVQQYVKRHQKPQKYGLTGSYLSLTSIAC